MKPTTIKKQALSELFSAISSEIASGSSIEGSIEYHPTDAVDEFEVMGSIRTGAPGQGGVTLIGEDE